MEDFKEQPSKRIELEEMPAEDQRNLVGFFELLLKVDKRVNPHLYQPKAIQTHD